MIAAAPRRAQCHALFVAMLPKIKRFASYAFRRDPKSCQEDMVAECIAFAYILFASLVERGKLDRAHPTPLARYACKRIRDGRRVGNRNDIRDVLSVRVQKQQGLFCHGLYERDEKGNWQDLVVEDRKTRPADVAACRVDFRAWLATLSLRHRRIAEALSIGETTSHVAERFKVTPGRVSQLRQELKRSWEAFHGEPVAEAA